MKRRTKQATKSPVRTTKKYKTYSAGSSGLQSIQSQRHLRSSQSVDIPTHDSSRVISLSCQQSKTSSLIAQKRRLNSMSDTSPPIPQFQRQCVDGDDIHPLEHHSHQPRTPQAIPSPQMPVYSGPQHKGSIPTLYKTAISRSLFPESLIRTTLPSIHASTINGMRRLFSTAASRKRKKEKKVPHHLRPKHHKYADMNKKHTGGFSPSVSPIVISVLRGSVPGDHGDDSTAEQHNKLDLFGGTNINDLNVIDIAPMSDLSQTPSREDSKSILRSMVDDSSAYYVNPEELPNYISPSKLPRIIYELCHDSTRPDGDIQLAIESILSQFSETKKLYQTTRRRILTAFNAPSEEYLPINALTILYQLRKDILYHPTPLEWSQLVNKALAVGFTAFALTVTQTMYDLHTSHYRNPTQILSGRKSLLYIDNYETAAQQKPSNSDIRKRELLVGAGTFTDHAPNTNPFLEIDQHFLLPIIPPSFNHEIPSLFAPTLYYVLHKTAKTNPTFATQCLDELYPMDTHPHLPIQLVDYIIQQAMEPYLKQGKQLASSSAFVIPTKVQRMPMEVLNTICYLLHSLHRRKQALPASCDMSTLIDAATLNNQPQLAAKIFYLALFNSYHLAHTIAAVDSSDPRHKAYAACPKPNEAISEYIANFNDIFGDSYSENFLLYKTNEPLIAAPVIHLNSGNSSSQSHLERYEGIKRQYTMIPMLGSIDIGLYNSFIRCMVTHNNIPVALATLRRVLYHLPSAVEHSQFALRQHFASKSGSDENDLIDIHQEITDPALLPSLVMQVDGTMRYIKSLPEHRHGRQLKQHTSKLLAKHIQAQDELQSNRRQDRENQSAAKQQADGHSSSESPDGDHSIDTVLSLDSAPDKDISDEAIEQEIAHSHLVLAPNADSFALVMTGLQRRGDWQGILSLFYTLENGLIDIHSPQDLPFHPANMMDINIPFTSQSFTRDASLYSKYDRSHRQYLDQAYIQKKEHLASRSDSVKSTSLTANHLKYDHIQDYFPSIFRVSSTVENTTMPFRLSIPKNLQTLNLVSEASKMLQLSPLTRAIDHLSAQIISFERNTATIDHVFSHVLDNIDRNSTTCPQDIDDQLHTVRTNLLSAQHTAMNELLTSPLLRVIPLGFALDAAVPFDCRLYGKSSGQRQELLETHEQLYSALLHANQQALSTWRALAELGSAESMNDMMKNALKRRNREFEQQLYGFDAFEMSNMDEENDDIDISSFDDESGSSTSESSAKNHHGGIPSSSKRVSARVFDLFQHTASGLMSSVSTRHGGTRKRRLPSLTKSQTIAITTAALRQHHIQEVLIALLEKNDVHAHPELVAMLMQYERFRPIIAVYSPVDIQKPSTAHLTSVKHTVHDLLNGIKYNSPNLVSTIKTKLERFLYFGQRMHIADIAGNIAHNHASPSSSPSSGGSSPQVPSFPGQQLTTPQSMSRELLDDLSARQRIFQLSSERKRTQSLLYSSPEYITKLLTEESRLRFPFMHPADRGLGTTSSNKPKDFEKILQTTSAKHAASTQNTRAKAIYNKVIPKHVLKSLSQQYVYESELVQPTEAYLSNEFMLDVIGMSITYDTMLGNRLTTIASSFNACYFADLNAIKQNAVFCRNHTRYYHQFVSKQPKNLDPLEASQMFQRDMLLHFSSPLLHRATLTELLSRYELALALALHGDENVVKLLRQADRALTGVPSILSVSYDLNNRTVYHCGYPLNTTEDIATLSSDVATIVPPRIRSGDEDQPHHGPTILVQPTSLVDYGIPLEFHITDGNLAKGKDTKTSQLEIEQRDYDPYTSLTNTQHMPNLDNLVTTEENTRHVHDPSRSVTTPEDIVKQIKKRDELLPDSHLSEELKQTLVTSNRYLQYIFGHRKTVYSTTLTHLSRRFDDVDGLRERMLLKQRHDKETIKKLQAYEDHQNELLGIVPQKFKHQKFDKIYTRTEQERKQFHSYRDSLRKILRSESIALVHQLNNVVLNMQLFSSLFHMVVQEFYGVSLEAPRSVLAAKAGSNHLTEQSKLLLSRFSRDAGNPLETALLQNSNQFYASEASELISGQKNGLLAHFSNMKSIQKYKHDPSMLALALTDGSFVETTTLPVPLKQVILYDKNRPVSNHAVVSNVIFHRRLYHLIDTSFVLQMMPDVKIETALISAFRLYLNTSTRLLAQSLLQKDPNKPLSLVPAPNEQPEVAFHRQMVMHQRHRFHKLLTEACGSILRLPHAPQFKHRSNTTQLQDVPSQRNRHSTISVHHDVSTSTHHDDPLSRVLSSHPIKTTATALITSENSLNIFTDRVGVIATDPSMNHSRYYFIPTSQNSIIKRILLDNQQDEITSVLNHHYRVEVVDVSHIHDPKQQRYVMKKYIKQRRKFNHQQQHSSSMSSPTSILDWISTQFSASRIIDGDSSTTKEPDSNDSEYQPSNRFGVIVTRSKSLQRDVIYTNIRAEPPVIGYPGYALTSAQDIDIGLLNTTQQHVTTVLKEHAASASLLLRAPAPQPTRQKQHMFPQEATILQYLSSNVHLFGDRALTLNLYYFLRQSRIVGTRLMTRLLTSESQSSQDVDGNHPTVQPAEDTTAQQQDPSGEQPAAQHDSHHDDVQPTQEKADQQPNVIYDPTTRRLFRLQPTAPIPTDVIDDVLGSSSVGDSHTQQQSQHTSPSFPVSFGKTLVSPNLIFTTDICKDHGALFSDATGDKNILPAVTPSAQYFYVGLQLAAKSHDLPQAYHTLVHFYYSLYSLRVLADENLFSQVTSSLGVNSAFQQHETRYIRVPFPSDVQLASLFLLEAAPVKTALTISLNNNIEMANTSLLTRSEEQSNEDNNAHKSRPLDIPKTELETNTALDLRAMADSLTHRVDLEYTDLITNPEKAIPPPISNAVSLLKYNAIGSDYKAIIPELRIAERELRKQSILTAHLAYQDEQLEEFAKRINPQHNPTADAQEAEALRQKQRKMLTRANALVPNLSLNEDISLECQFGSIQHATQAFSALTKQGKNGIKNSSIFLLSMLQLESKTMAYYKHQMRNEFNKHIATWEDSLRQYSLLTVENDSYHHQREQYELDQEILELKEQYNLYKLLHQSMTQTYLIHHAILPRILALERQYKHNGKPSSPYKEPLHKSILRSKSIYSIHQYLKLALQRGQYPTFTINKIHTSLYPVNALLLDVHGISPKISPLLVTFLFEQLYTSYCIQRLTQLAYATFDDDALHTIKPTPVDEDTRAYPPYHSLRMYGTDRIGHRSGSENNQGSDRGADSNMQQDSTSNHPLDNSTAQQGVTHEKTNTDVNPIRKPAQKLTRQEILAQLQKRVVNHEAQTLKEKNIATEQDAVKDAMTTYDANSSLSTSAAAVAAYLSHEPSITKSNFNVKPSFIPSYVLEDVPSSTLATYALPELSLGHALAHGIAVATGKGNTVSLTSNRLLVPGVLSTYTKSLLFPVPTVAYEEPSASKTINTPQVGVHYPMQTPLEHSTAYDQKKNHQNKQKRSPEKKDQTPVQADGHVYYQPSALQQWMSDRFHHDFPTLARVPHLSHPQYILNPDRVPRLDMATVLRSRDDDNNDDDRTVTSMDNTHHTPNESDQSVKTALQSLIFEQLSSLHQAYHHQYEKITFDHHNDPIYSALGSSSFIAPTGTTPRQMIREVIKEEISPSLLNPGSLMNSDPSTHGHGHRRKPLSGKGSRSVGHTKASSTQHQNETSSRNSSDALANVDLQDNKDLKPPSTSTLDSIDTFENIIESSTAGSMNHTNFTYFIPGHSHLAANAYVMHDQSPFFPILSPSEITKELIPMHSTVNSSPRLSLDDIQREIDEIRQPKYAIPLLSEDSSVGTTLTRQGKGQQKSKRLISDPRIHLGEHRLTTPPTIMFRCYDIPDNININDDNDNGDDNNNDEDVNQ